MKRRTFISGALGFGTAGLAMTLVTAPPLWRMPGRDQTLDAGAQRFSGADLAFGTTLSIEVVHDDRRQAEQAISDALAAAKQVDLLMTLHRADSQVAILNRTGFLADPHPHLRAVLESAAHLSRLTQGAFDVTVQPLWQAYAAAAARGALPDAATRRTAMAMVDWRQLVVSERHVALQRPGMAMTLNGIAQGYALDRARATLSAHGIRHALLDIGEFAAQGQKSTRHPWTVGIRDPRNPQQLASMLPMDGRCVATSGDYETVFSADFAHHHIFNPASGASPTELASVTVLAPTGLQADGLSTAMMVLGRDKAIALASSLSSVDVLLIGKDGRKWQSAHVPALLS